MSEVKRDGWFLYWFLCRGLLALRRIYTKKSIKNVVPVDNQSRKLRCEVNCFREALGSTSGISVDKLKISVEREEEVVTQRGTDIMRNRLQQRQAGLARRGEECRV